MPPSAEAQRNHDELFPGHVSTLKVTDPELIEYFDNSPSTKSSAPPASTLAPGSWCSSPR